MGRPGVVLQEFFFGGGFDVLLRESPFIQAEVA